MRASWEFTDSTMMLSFCRGAFCFGGPASAEEFDQGDGGDEAFATDARDLAFAGEFVVLGDGDFEVGDEAGFVAIFGDAQCAAGCVEGLLPGGKFGGEKALRG